MTLDSYPEFETRHSRRAKRLILTVHADGRAVLTVPPQISQRAVRLFLAEQRGWLEKQLAQSRKPDPNRIFLPAGRRDYLRNREKARRFAHACLETHNLRYRHQYGKVFIKNLYASWGSCSSAGNLNFNYKIIHLPLPLAEYIVVHELCHLREMNHSVRFWNLVARAIPDHKQRRRQLRSYEL